MDKRYIAFNGSAASGIVTHDAAVAWASDQMSKQTVNKIHIAEVIETVERRIPPVDIKTYTPPDQLLSKAA